MECAQLIFWLSILLGSAGLNDAAVGDWVKPPISALTKSGTFGQPLSESQLVGQTSLYVEVEGGTSYTLLSQPIDGPFTLQSNGTLNTTKRLDYEKITSYALVVEACALGGSTSATVTVLVKDMNDNPPKFPFKQYFVPVADNLTAGSYVTRIQATDADRSFYQSYIAEYSVSGGDYEHFYLAGTSGEIFVAIDKMLSSSVKKNYTFKLTARDNGTPQRQGSTDVTVCVGCLQSDSVRIVPSSMVLMAGAIGLLCY